MKLQIPDGGRRNALPGQDYHASRGAARPSTDRRWNEDYQEKIEDARRRNCSATSSTVNRHTWRHQGVSLRLWCKNPTSKDLNCIEGVPPTAKVNLQQIESSSISTEKDVSGSRKCKRK